ncbi:MAG: hypothetical protein LBU11_02540 [Zoogloeaceae bacterium]|jgi:hypothetical protein|nr:hypothetical protein [Zoogloeaceae bacterium]
MQDTERETYMTLKKRVLSIYFHFCRTRAVLSGWRHSAVLGGVEYEFDCASNPIEQIMTDVVCLGLGANWHPEAKNTRSSVQSQIDTYGGWEVLLSDLTEEEAKLLRHDLKSLKLIA